MDNHTHNPLFEPTKGTRKFNKKIFGFDIETYDNNKKFYCASIYSAVNPELNKTFFNKQELGDYFKRPIFNNSVIAATNLSFDFMGSFFGKGEMKEFELLWRGSDLLAAHTHLYEGGFELKYNKAHHSDRRGLLFIDTLNYANLSVKRLGQLVNLSKCAAPACLGRLPKTEQEKQEILVYNMRDSEISCKAMHFMFGAFSELGADVRRTISSTAMSLYKSRFLKDKYWRHQIPDLLNEFKAYYGGRTEAFIRGEIQDYYVYDFNSLYPSVMLNEFPDPNSMHHTWRNTVENLEFEGMSHVDIEAPAQMDYPLLPWRDTSLTVTGKVRPATKLYFPLGRFSGWYSHVELRKAVELGYHILKVRETYYFTKSCRPFYEYVTSLYALRLKYKAEGNPMEYVVKLLLNSLYGKFGQKFTNRDTVQPFTQTIEQLRKIKEFERIGDYIRIKKDLVDPPSFTIPVFPVYVTAYARIKLWEKINQCQPAYVDTDSLFTKKEYPNSNELGKLKLEMKIRRGIIVKPKFYALQPYDKEAYIKIKGVGCKVTMPIFQQLLLNPSITYQKFMKFRESIRRGFIPNELQNITKELSLEDDKRDWLAPFNATTTQYSNPLKIYNGKVYRPSILLSKTQPVCEKEIFA
jgi:hypothetical protein